MHKPSFAAAMVAMAGLGFSPSPVAAQGDVDQQLGSVHFKTSCNEVAQRRFDRAMRYQHSYWYLNAKEIFEEALKADPTCAMAQWGIALTYSTIRTVRSRGPTWRPASPPSRRPRRWAPRPSASATTSMRSR